MTRRERQDLADVVKMRARVTKGSLKTLAADRQADVEAQLSAIQRADDERWRDVTAEAARLVKAANEELARRCDAVGIPKELRPGLCLGWSERGQAAYRQPRS